MADRVVVAGASGFIGKAVQRAWRARGDEVVTIGRSGADVRWGDADGIRRAVSGSAMLVNLAGRSVNCRYNDRNRAEILNSRIRTTSALRTAVARASDPPPVWLNASTATTYSHTTEQAHTEADPAGQKGFSEDVARAWEAALMHGDLPGTRRIPLRMTIVLGSEGDATNLLFTLARLGIGGTQFDGPWLPHSRYRSLGSRKGTADAVAPSGARPTGGQQRFSWMHVDDIVRAMEHIRAHDEIDGPVNLATDDAHPNADFMRVLRETVGAPVGMPAFRWMLEPAMWALRTESELVLKSRWVRSQVLADTGFEFAHPTLSGALQSIWQEVRQG
ncbi:epimerase [Agrococcus casei]|uniref:Cell division inhibitor n=1 Tax=Agrococcus casei LMG 22410 TaxID=1255656 RepID=A0A1R4FF85_9MICO|nr:DUF1731 domain-containing protein [Agrococcus casei]SJM54650.1 Cell division inhibitor [Agrococcus casei LMG 22410]